MFGEILCNNDLTIKDVSEGTGLPRSTIADLVKGRTSIDKMSAGNLYRLSSYFGVNMQDFFIYCRLPEIEDVRLFMERENDRIVDSGLKVYVAELSDNHLVETAHALHDTVRFQKYMSAVRDFYKYRKIQLPERYIPYLSDLAGGE